MSARLYILIWLMYSDHGDLPMIIIINGEILPSLSQRQVWDVKHVGSQCFKIRIPIKLSPSTPCQRSSQRKHHQSSAQSYQTVNKEPRNTSMTGQCTWETASETRTVTAEARNPTGGSLWCYLQNIHSAPALWRAGSASLRSVVS